MNTDRSQATEDDILDVFVVGVGASAGGLEALRSMLEHVPDDCPHCFVVVQHLSPNHKSMMQKLLSNVTWLSVRTLEGAESPVPGTVFLLPPGKRVVLEQGRLTLHERATDERLHPIDDMFRSLAEQQGDRAIGIVLSGTGNDGIGGIRAIKEAGGMVMVQSPEQAKFDGMPQSAIRTHLVDFVLPAEELPLALHSFIRHFYDGTSAANASAAIEHEQVESSLEHVLKIVQRTTGIDFLPYKPQTLRRRIERRISIARCADFDEYVGRLYQDPTEAQTLTRDFLIGVTKFFRDPRAWETLASQVLPDLVARKKARPHEPIRVWSAGCSTGEEAYTLAILLSEEMKRQGLDTETKVFATDLFRGGLEVASRGVYPASVVADVPALFQHRYFRSEGNEMRVVAPVRNMMLFSAHNLLRDPPFGRMDLVVCRNALIYLKPEAQERALRVLQYALNVGGVLFLGPSESIAAVESDFNVIDASAKIYRNTRTIRHIGEGLLTPRRARAQPLGNDAPSARELAMNRALARTAVASLGLVAIHVDHELGILHVEGDLRQYLALPEEGFSANLGELLPPTVATKVRQATLGDRAPEQRRRIAGVSFDVDGQERQADIIVQAMTSEHQRMLGHLVVFVPRDSSASVGSIDDEWVQSVRDRTGLDEELQDARTRLQAALQEADTTNEELQATNEELLASNEELQNVNEELQSVNEELHSVNAEYQQKLDELVQANADMDNLIQSTQIGTLFLDADMRIRKFTPTVVELFRLHEIDVGRPLEHFATALVGERSTEIVQTARDVMHDGLVNISEVRLPDGKCFLRRIEPFRRGTDGQIDGVVLSFVDITAHKTRERRLQQVIEAQARALVNTVAVSWEYRVDRAVPMSPSLCTLLGYELGELPVSAATLGRLIDPRDAPDAIARIEGLMRDKGELYEASFRMRRKDGALLSASTSGHCIEHDQGGRPRHIVFVTQRQAEESSAPARVDGRG